MTQNLTEKYRPKDFEDLVGQEQIKQRLEQVNIDDLQHLMFVGPAGVGKTTTANILKRKLYDEQGQSMNFKELNASDERGIDTVRENIKDFARTKAINSDKNILFLDESDSLTESAMQSLRRVMEKYSNNCVFILSGNYDDNFIDPIKSRCMVLEFDRIMPEDIQERLEEICREEGLDYSDDALQKIAVDSDGDMRSAINSLWFAIDDGKVTAERVHTAIDQMEAFVDCLSQANYLSSREEKDKLVRKGIEPEKIVSQLYDFVKTDEQLPKEAKAVWLEELADSDWRMSRDTVKELQLDRMVWRICRKTKEFMDGN